MKENRIFTDRTIGYGSVPRDEGSGKNGIVDSSTVQSKKKIFRELTTNERNVLSALGVITVLILIVSSIDLLKSSRQMEDTNGIGVNTAREGSFHETVSEIPFPHVDRSDYSVPPDAILNPNLFAQSLRNELANGTSFLKDPIPTGAFWTNLVLSQTIGTGDSFPIMTYPYAYEWGPGKLVLGYPSLRRIMDELSIRDIFNPDLTISTEEVANSRYVTKYDPLSVTLRYDIDSSRFWETYLVQGSPWTTMRFKNVKPTIHALSVFMGIECPPVSDCSIGSFDPYLLSIGAIPYTLVGTNFIVRSLEDITYLIVSSRTVTLSMDTVMKTTVTLTEPFDGVLRVALLPPEQKDEFPYTNSFPSEYSLTDVHTSTTYDSLMKSFHIYPVGANVDWDFEPSKDDDEGTVAKIKFSYETKSMFEDPSLPASNDCDENVDLLMATLPHQTQVLENPLLDDTEFDLAFRTMKGYMSFVRGSCWVMSEELTNIGLDGPFATQRVQNMTGSVRDKILESIKVDMGQVLPVPNENVYGYGKQVARLAQLAYIAHSLKYDDETETMSNDITTLLHSYVVDYLTGNVKDHLVYDRNFGGMVSIDGLSNSGGDFGNGWYNDHHFHYGYILYACGVLGKLNSTFASEYGKYVDAIMYDVTFSEHSNSDDYTTDTFSFPFTRHKAWFDGHSYASGLFPFANGKSQESSTESINCYYGAYIWSTVRSTHNQRVTDFARLLLATEIRSVKLYWHMNPDGTGNNIANNPMIYNPIFAENLMVGNSAMMDVTISTWFGTEPKYVHLINFMPITAITRDVFDKSYVEKQFNTIIKPIYDDIEMAWKGYAVCNRALIEPLEAWKDALEIRSNELDQSISLSQILYFIATMDGFNPDVDEAIAAQTVKTIPTNAPTAILDNKEACAANWKCNNLGLVGLCCPTAGGIKLDCCD